MAFALCVRISSPAIAGMLIAGGVIMQIPPLQAIAQAGVISVPGPIFGVISFADVLILGVVKGVTTWRTRRAARTIPRVGK